MLDAFESKFQRPGDSHVAVIAMEFPWEIQKKFNAIDGNQWIAKSDVFLFQEPWRSCRFTGFLRDREFRFPGRISLSEPLVNLLGDRIRDFRMRVDHIIGFAGIVSEAIQLPGVRFVVVEEFVSLSRQVIDGDNGGLRSRIHVARKQVEDWISLFTCIGIAQDVGIRFTIQRVRLSRWLPFVPCKLKTSWVEIEAVNLTVAD